MSDSAIAKMIGAILGNLGAIVFVVGAAVAYIRIRRANARGMPVVSADVYWRELIFFGVGIAFVWYGMLHAFFAGVSDRYIGWQPSPFEFELGFAEIGIGIVALFARTRNRDLGLGVTIIYGVFSLAAAAQHIYFIVCCANINPGNAGIILWFNDIALPLVLFWLAWRAGAATERVRASDAMS